MLSALWQVPVLFRELQDFLPHGRQSELQITVRQLPAGERSEILFQEEGPDIVSAVGLRPGDDDRPLLRSLAATDHDHGSAAAAVELAPPVPICIRGCRDSAILEVPVDVVFLFQALWKQLLWRQTGQPTQGRFPGLA